MPKRKTTDEFIKKAKEKHGNKYDYSLVKYQGNKTKVKIICSKHGIFEQTPNNHLNGNGCLKCAGNIKSTTAEFIKKAKEKHGNKYDYSRVEYINAKTKVKIICSEHGIFEQQPTHHTQGKGCPKCVGKNKTTEEFIQEAKTIHGNKYDYSKVDYQKSYEKVKIICFQHGEFEQRSIEHLRGTGCPKCAGNIKLTKSEFITKAKGIHGNQYDYSQVEYVNIDRKVKILCKKHGLFEQTPSNHLNGKGCLKCAGKNKTTADFIKEAKEIHGNKYDYSKVEYIKSNQKVKIICQKHGLFEQAPSNHLQGNGCPKCNFSKGEQKIEAYLNEKNINFESQKRFDKLKHKSYLLYDFYLPDFNLLIEYDGIQHVKPVDQFGGEKGFKQTQKRDKLKNEFVKKNRIDLLRISYLEFDQIEEILDSKLTTSTLSIKKQLNLFDFL
jgi:very-short-patch-repair endonuclease